jgi:membrane fusion protein (multidrug efflux system)
MAETNNSTPKNNVAWKIAPLAAIVLLAAGVWIYHYAVTYESTDDAFIDAHIIPIAPKVAGQVLKVYVDDNQGVKAGDPLVQIDPADYKAKVEEDRARVAAAEAEALRTQDDVTRYEELIRRDEVSKQQLDHARAAARSAAANADKERATLQQAELNLSYTDIRAPETGNVTHKTVEEGAYVQVGQSLLALVPENAWVTANFKETQLTHMRPGQPVKIKIDAYPDQTFRGHVDSIQAGTGERFSVMPPENATGNYVKVVQRIPVKILIDASVDPKFRLAPGMSVVPTVKVR